MKTHYELLEIAPDASLDDIKHAFRHQIARYHPDKVQHLGRELQELAATRTAELTDAYRVLSDPDQRRVYDQALDVARDVARDVVPSPPPPASPEPPPDRGGEEMPRSGSPFLQDRQRRDEVVRRASVDRLRRALAAELGDGVEQPLVRGFDLAYVPRAKLFSRQRLPRVLGRFVGRVDGPALIEARTRAAAWSREDVCLFLLGAEIAPARELAEATAPRPREAARVGRVVVVPVDVRDWRALIPNAASPFARAVVGRLRRGTSS